MALAGACDFIARYAVDDGGQALIQPGLLVVFNAMRLTSTGPRGALRGSPSPAHPHGVLAWASGTHSDRLGQRRL